MIILGDIGADRRWDCTDVNYLKSLLIVDILKSKNKY